MITKYKHNATVFYSQNFIHGLASVDAQKATYQPAIPVTFSGLGTFRRPGIQSPPARCRCGSRWNRDLIWMELLAAAISLSSLASCCISTYVSSSETKLFPANFITQSKTLWNTIPMNECSEKIIWCPCSQSRLLILSNILSILYSHITPSQSVNEPEVCPYALMMSTSSMTSQTRSLSKRATS